MDCLIAIFQVCLISLIRLLSQRRFLVRRSVVEYPQSVSISCATEGAVIHYTTNGTAPTSSSTLYEGEIEINSNTTLKARAFKEDWNDSDIATANFFSLMDMIPVPGGTFTMGRTREVETAMSFPLIT